MVIWSLYLGFMFFFRGVKKTLMATTAVTDAYAVSICAAVGGFGHPNATTSSTAAMVSGAAAPTGNGTFTGGSGVIKGCGTVVLVGLLVGGIVVAL